jgi:hypothetical protein
MLQQLDIKLVEHWHGFDEYYIFYDDTYMTQEQAEKELEFMDMGMGYDLEKYPYYLIVPAAKKPILSAIKEFLTDQGYDMAHNIAMEEKYGHD